MKAKAKKKQKQKQRKGGREGGFGWFEGSGTGTRVGKGEQGWGQVVEATRQAAVLDTTRTDLSTLAATTMLLIEEGPAAATTKSLNWMRPPCR